MMRKLSVIVVGMLLVASCSQGVKNNVSGTIPLHYEDFPRVDTLYGENVEFDSILLTPIQIQLYDSILVLMNLRGEQMVDLFNLSSHQLAGRRISLGQGPKEMLIPRLVQTDGNDVVLSDLQRPLLMRYSWPDFLCNPDPEPSDRITLSKRPYGDVGILGDRYIAPARNVNYLFYRYNAAGELVDTLGHYPDPGWQTTDMEKIDMFTFFFATNRKDRVAVCYNWADIIDIYNASGKLLRRLHGPRQVISRYKEVRHGKVVSSMGVDNETYDAFYQPVGVGDEFWVPFSGQSDDEEGYSRQTDKLLVFDWDGNPLRLYYLDQEIRHIAVDAVHHRIYAISDSPEFHLLMFTYDS